MDKAKKIKLLVLVLMSMTTAIISAQILSNFPMDSNPSKRIAEETIFMNYEDNLLGNDTAIEGIDYELLWFSPTTAWTVFGSGTTNSDGLIYVNYPVGFDTEAQNYKIVFLNEWSHIAEITQLAGLYVSEIEFSVPEITTNVVWSDDLTPAIDVGIEIYHDSVYIATLNTDEFGVIVFKATAGLLEFTALMTFDTVILANDTSVSIDIEIARILLIGKIIGHTHITASIMWY